MQVPPKQPYKVQYLHFRYLKLLVISFSSFPEGLAPHLKDEDPRTWGYVVKISPCLVVVPQSGPRVVVKHPFQMAFHFIAYKWRWP